MSSSIKKSKISVGDLVTLDPASVLYTTHVDHTERVGLVTGVDNRYYRQQGSEAIYAPWDGEADGLATHLAEADKIDRVTVLWSPNSTTTHEPADCLIKIAKVKKNEESP